MKGEVDLDKHRPQRHKCPKCSQYVLPVACPKDVFLVPTTRRGMHCGITRHHHHYACGRAWGGCGHLFVKT